MTPPRLGGESLRTEYARSILCQDMRTRSGRRQEVGDYLWDPSKWDSSWLARPPHHPPGEPTVRGAWEQQCSESMGVTSIKRSRRVNIRNAWEANINTPTPMNEDDGRHAPLEACWKALRAARERDWKRQRAAGPPSGSSPAARPGGGRTGGPFF